MLASWATEEMQTAKLKDARLNERLTKLLSDLGERPAASIPEACGGKNEIDAAYRFSTTRRRPIRRFSNHTTSGRANGSRSNPWSC